MSDTVIIRGQRYEVHECITCGVVYTCPATVIEYQRANGGSHTCSNGHSQGWTKDGSESERIRRERDRLKQQQARLEQEKAEAWSTANAQRERAEKAEASTRRLKKRASAGTCPCCKRTFSNMSTHMKKQHPDFGSEKPQLKVVS